MRRWILALPGLFLALSLTAECKEPPHSLTPYAGAKQSADGGNPAKPPHELKAARQATARQLIAAALDEVKQTHGDLGKGRRLHLRCQGTGPCGRGLARAEEHRETRDEIRHGVTIAMLLLPDR